MSFPDLKARGGDVEYKRSSFIELVNTADVAAESARLLELVIKTVIELKSCSSSADS